LIEVQPIVTPVACKGPRFLGYIAAVVGENSKGSG
jgi:hypothetical protein